MVRFTVIMLLVYAGVIAFGLNEFRKTPRGFIPPVDRGYLIVVEPAAARAPRSPAPTRCSGAIVDIALKTPGVNPTS